jgi:hypothetical protein
VGPAGVIGWDGSIAGLIAFSGAAKGFDSGRIVVVTVGLVAVLFVELDDSKVAVAWLITGRSVARAVLWKSAADRISTVNPKQNR